MPRYHDGKWDWTKDPLPLVLFDTWRGAELPASVIAYMADEFAYPSGELHAIEALIESGDLTEGRLDYLKKLGWIEDMVDEAAAWLEERSILPDGYHIGYHDEQGWFGVWQEEEGETDQFDEERL